MSKRWWVHVILTEIEFNTDGDVLSETSGELECEAIAKCATLETAKRIYADWANDAQSSYVNEFQCEHCGEEGCSEQTCANAGLWESLSVRTRALINRIVDRVLSMPCGLHKTREGLIECLVQCHRVVPLDFERMNTCKQCHMIHDVFGIHRNWSVKEQRLLNDFQPRITLKENGNG